MKSWAFLIAIFLALQAPALAQDPDQGIDPHDFSDASDEAADEAFFHLERFFQVGFMGGFGLFTGGLGSSHSLGGGAGFNLIFFFDSLFAFEIATLITYQTNRFTGVDTTLSTSTFTQDSTTWLIIPNFNVRFYFPTSNLSRFLASLNPYLVGGVDWIIRKQSIQSSTFVGGLPTGATAGSESNPGLNLGFGITSLVHGDFLYLGFDVRFHYMILKGENDSTQGFSRDGDYFTFLGTLTYNY